ncbi:hypothetical protein PFISCL1PPCAC_9624, partial [Pristionchus fissidentatus]
SEGILLYRNLASHNFNWITFKMTTSMERELEALGRFRMGKIIGGKWKIVQKLDEGGFGSVYKVQNLKDSKLFGALKIELSRADEANHLKLETEVMKNLHAEGFRSHIPALYRSGKKKSYCYMILSLLGENLKRLKEKHFSKGMPMRTLTRVGIQALYAIKTMHDRGYVHRDIKPGNFVLGYHAQPAVARFVYIIDFGLARAYAYPPTKDSIGHRWLARKARGHLDFKGTWRFASPTMHEEKEQGRKDDIWSFLYMLMLIDLYCGLPWSDSDDRKTAETKKLHISDTDLMIRMPEEFKFIPTLLRALNVYQRPEYYRIFMALDKVREKCKVTFEDPHEWELREFATANKSALRKMQPTPGYTKPDGFFNWDPLLICGPPSPRDEEEIKARFKKGHSTNGELTDTTGQNTRTGSGPEQLEGQSPNSVSNAPGHNKTLVTFSMTGGKSGLHTAKLMVDPTRRSSKGRKGKHEASPSGSSRKKKSTSEDSVDFIPSCYLNMDIPKHYLIDGRGDQKEVQKGAIKVDWAHMADGRCPDKPSVEKVTHSREAFSKEKVGGAMSGEKIPDQVVIKSAEAMREKNGAARVPSRLTRSNEERREKKFTRTIDNRKTKKSVLEKEGKKSFVEK